MFDLERELHNTKVIVNFFRLATAYFYGPFDDKVQMAKLVFQSRGGRVVEQIDTDSIGRLSHVIVNDGTTDGISSFQNEFSFVSAEHLKRIRFVSFQWILDCNCERRKISDKIYFVK